jgi:hypothetical protein
MRRRFRLTKAKTMAEYIIVTLLLMTCSVALYFSVLVTGTEKLGTMLCNECPKTPHNSVDPWDQDSEDQARDDEGNDENQDDSAIPDEDTGANDDFGGLDDEFSDYFWDSFFDWDNWFSGY